VNEDFKNINKRNMTETPTAVLILMF